MEIAEPNIVGLFKKIVEVRKKVRYVQKKRSPGLQYSAVTYDAVILALRDAMDEVGLSLSTSVKEYKLEQVLTRTKKGESSGWNCAMLVTILLTDADTGQSISGESLGQGLDTQDKATGKAHTYAVKTWLIKTFLLETGDEDPDQHAINMATKKSYQGTKANKQQLNIYFQQAGIEDPELMRSMAQDFIGMAWDDIKEKLKID